MLIIEEELKRANSEGVQKRWALWCLSRKINNFLDFNVSKPYDFIIWNNRRIVEFNKTTSELRHSKKWHYDYNEYLIKYVKLFLHIT